MVCAFVYIYVHVSMFMQTHVERICWHWVSSFNHFSILYFETGFLLNLELAIPFQLEWLTSLLSLWSALPGVLGLHICTVHLFPRVLVVIWTQVLVCVWQTLYPLSSITHCHSNIFCNVFFSALGLRTTVRIESHDYLTTVTVPEGGLG